MLGDLSHDDDTSMWPDEDSQLRRLRPRPSPFAALPWLFEVQVGIAAPTGAVGLFADYSLAEWLSINLGVGTNLVGVEAASELRVRFAPGSGRTMTMGLGYSLGPHEQTEITRLGLLAPWFGPMTQMGQTKYPSRYVWDLAHWVNLSAGYEGRERNGNSLRIFGGVGILLNPEEGRPEPPENEMSRWTMDRAQVLFFGAVAFGWAR
jgi:hypothetical protein